MNPMRNEELVRRASRDVQESRRAKEVHSAVHLTYKGRPDGDRLSTVGQRQSGSSREVGSAAHSTSQQPERRDVDIVKPTSSRSCGRPHAKSRKNQKGPLFLPEPGYKALEMLQTLRNSLKGFLHLEVLNHFRNSPVKVVEVSLKGTLLYLKDVPASPSILALNHFRIVTTAITRWQQMKSWCSQESSPKVSGMS